jgi:hypothetical protein
MDPNHALKEIVTDLQLTHGEVRSEALADYLEDGYSHGDSNDARDPDGYSHGTTIEVRAWPRRRASLRHHRGEDVHAQAANARKSDARKPANARKSDARTLPEPDSDENFFARISPGIVVYPQEVEDLLEDEQIPESDGCSHGHSDDEDGYSHGDSDEDDIARPCRRPRTFMARAFELFLKRTSRRRSRRSSTSRTTGTSRGRSCRRSSTSRAANTPRRQYVSHSQYTLADALDAVQPAAWVALDKEFIVWTDGSTGRPRAARQRLVASRSYAADESDASDELDFEEESLDEELIVWIAQIMMTLQERFRHNDSMKMEEIADAIGDEDLHYELLR